MKRQIEGVVFNRAKLSKSWHGEIDGQRVVVENTGRYRERWVVHPWPKMVKYPPLLAKAETMTKAVQQVLAQSR